LSQHPEARPTPTTAATAAAAAAATTATIRRLLCVQRYCCGAGGGGSDPGVVGLYTPAASTQYRYRPDGHTYTAHEGVTAEHALGVVREIIKRCRSLAVLTTHAADQGDAGLASRVVGVRFDEEDELGQPDLRRAALGTNPQTRKAAQLAADGRVTFTFFSNASEGCALRRVRSRCRFVPPCIHCIPDLL
jgi:hypothetical protein